MESRDLSVRTSLSATTTLPLRASTATSLSAPALRDSTTAPKEGGAAGELDLAGCAARLESQFNRVLARQNVQDETSELVAALNRDLAEINAKLSLLQPADAVKTASSNENVSPAGSAMPTSPPVPALKAKLEREARELAVAQVTGSRDTNQLYRLEARMDQQDANSALPTSGIALIPVRALTMAVETLAAKIVQQTKQHEEIAALRDELADMSKWCARFNAAHDRTLSRCAALEEKLAVANLDLARLRIEAVTRERKAKEGESTDELEINREVGELNIPRQLQNAAPTNPATPVHRQVASLKPPPKTNSAGRPKVNPAPSLPELPPNSPFTLKM